MALDRETCQQLLDTVERFVCERLFRLREGTARNQKRVIARNMRREAE